ncbi:hypothetical protein BDV06DRAFT_204387 [Aspergillus oleicola]
MSSQPMSALNASDYLLLYLFLERCWSAGASLVGDRAASLRIWLVDCHCDSRERPANTLSRQKGRSKHVCARPRRVQVTKTCTLPCKCAVASSNGRKRMTWRARERRSTSCIPVTYRQQRTKRTYSMPPSELLGFESHYSHSPEYGAS